MCKRMNCLVVSIKSESEFISYLNSWGLQKKNLDCEPQEKYLQQPVFEMRYDVFDIFRILTGI